MRGYVKKIKCAKFILYLASYQDYVDDLAKLSKSLQSDDLSVSDVRSLVEATVNEIKLKINDDGK